MIQIVVSVVVIIVAVLFIVIRNYKKAKAINRGTDICKSIECNVCKEKTRCNKSQKS